MKNKTFKQLSGLILLLAIVGVVLYVAKIGDNKPAPNKTQEEAVNASDTKSIKIGDTIIDAILAQTPEERAQGLSGRPNLPPNTGMLFLFPEPGTYAFWMKDMLFNIDMIWISADRKIVYIEKNATPESYPKAFGPKDPAMYVLEVPAGFSDEHGLEEGDAVQFIK